MIVYDLKMTYQEILKINESQMDRYHTSISIWFSAKEKK